MKTLAFCCSYSVPSSGFFPVVAARAWDSFLCGKTGISSLITSCTRNTGGRKIHCRSGRQQYVLFTPDTCFLVFLQIDTDSRVSVSYDEVEEALKLEGYDLNHEILNVFTAQDSCKTQPTAEWVIHFPYLSGLLSLWGMSLHQQSFLICKYSISVYYVFSFKFPSNWSLEVLFLTLICVSGKKSSD